MKLYVACFRITGMVSGLLQTHVGDQYIPLVAVTMFADRQQLGIAALAIVYARWRPRPWHQLQQQLGIAAAARLARHCNILSPGRCSFCAPAEWRARPTVPQLLRCVPWHAEAVQSWEMGWAMGATKGIQHVKHPAWGPGPAYNLLLNQQRSTGDIHHDVWWLSEVRAMSTVVMVPAYLYGSTCACRGAAVPQRCSKRCHVLPQRFVVCSHARPCVVVAARGWASLPLHTTSLASAPEAWEGS